MTSLLSGTASALRGRAAPPGDKSISHRALLLGALAVGETVIDGLLESDDVRGTADALRALGVGISREETKSSAPQSGDNQSGDNRYRVNGVGLGGLRQPSETLHMGNSGTGARLLMGVLATHPVTAVLTGDSSLNERPMARVTEPLRRTGAEIQARDGERLPATVRGAAEPVPLTHTLAVASAQVKSALLLAGLNAPGQTSVTEPLPSRDHTERLLRHFGVTVDTEQEEEEGGAQTVTLTGYPEIAAAQVSVPGDPSSAAFPAVAALILPGSEVTLEGVCVNPLRMGLYDTLGEMGADITIENQRDSCGEPVADLVVRTPRDGLRGIEVSPARAPSMIDEYPILAVAAAFAQGTTVLHGLAELRVKESDRLAAMARGLAACGVTVKEEEDSLTIEGQGTPPAGGATIDAGLDHRMAMAFLVFGMAAKKPVTVEGSDVIATSFPGFAEIMNGLGAAIAETKEAS
ncbi:MAG: 3-phosphoshikimate 1-carboxyvinyltransferase [Alphaproteobacteria bacterium]|nr:3-phosphoshikimate 1-carboxyvinyltransferase [Alphaproteobacteria bacterium]